MPKGDYSSLARCHEALKHLAAQPSVIQEFEYAKNEDLPLQTTLTQHINGVRNQYQICSQEIIGAHSRYVWGILMI